MTKPIKIVRQQSSVDSSQSQLIRFFSKNFSPTDASCQTIVVHDDFPMITKADVDKFALYCKDSKEIVVSGCTAGLHPYRLIFQNHDRFCQPLVNIPQSIRGNRHLYPEILQVIPALVSFPEGIREEELTGSFTPDIYILESDKLLDKTRFPDSLFLTQQRGF